MEETQCRDSGQTCRHENDILGTAVKRPGVDYNVSGEGKSIFISPSKQQQQLYPPRFLHPAHRHSIPTHHPLFYAACRWNLVLDVPEDKKIDRLAHPKAQKRTWTSVVLPFLTSPLLWVLSEVTSQVNTHESAIEEKKRGSAFKTTEASLWCSHWGLQQFVSVRGHVQVGFRPHVLLNQQFCCSSC